MSVPISLVTGAAGFIGSHLVEALLAKGEQVRALDLPNAKFKSAIGRFIDHPNLTLVRRDLMSIPADDPVYAGVGVVFHCAAITHPGLSMQEPEQFIQTNVMGSIRLLEAARHHRVRKLIHLSSAAVYGVATPPIAEGSPPSPLSPYGLSKLMVEQACIHWSRVLGVPTTSFRLFNCYGPRTTGGPIGSFIVKALRGEPLTITGDGEQQRDFLHVSDAVSAFIMEGACQGGGGIYNLGTGQPVTMNQIARLIGAEIRYVPARAGEPKVILADTAKIRSELGWVPNMSLADGIRDLKKYVESTMGVEPYDE